jgi:hypothetical protein
VLKRFTLGQAAIPYIRSWIGIGDDALGPLLLNLPLEAGTVTAWLPPGTPPAYLIDRLESGAVIAPGQHEPWMGSFIVRYLQGGQGRYVVEPTFMRPGDPPVAALKVPFFTYQRQVYVYLPWTRPDLALAERVLCHGRAYPFVAALTSLPEGHAKVGSGEDVAESSFSLLAQRAEMLLVGAYDEETAIVWERPAAQRPTLRT